MRFDWLCCTIEIADWFSPISTCCWSIQYANRMGRKKLSNSISIDSFFRFFFFAFFLSRNGQSRQFLSSWRWSNLTCNWVLDTFPIDYYMHIKLLFSFGCTILPFHFFFLDFDFVSERRRGSILVVFVWRCAFLLFFSLLSFRACNFRILIVTGYTIN